MRKVKHMRLRDAQPVEVVMSETEMHGEEPESHDRVLILYRGGVNTNASRRLRAQVAAWSIHRGQDFNWRVKVIL